MSARTKIIEKLHYYRPPVVHSLLASAVVTSVASLFYHNTVLTGISFSAIALIALVEGIAYVAK